MRTPRILHLRSLGSAVIPAALSTMILAIATTLFAQAGYLFLHPGMEGKPWGPTLSSMNFDASPTLFDLNPGSYSVGNRIPKTNSAFIAQSDNSLYVMKSEFTSRCIDALRYHVPVQVQGMPPFPAADLPVHVITTADTGFDTALVAYPLSSGNLRIAGILTRNGTIIDSQDISLSGMTAGEDILHISAESNPIQKTDTLLWITGVNGAIRSIPLTPAGIAGTETVHDIGAADITAFENGYAGSASGALYALDRQSGTFSQVFEYADSPSLWIQGGKGLTTDGTLLFADGNTWSTAQLGISNARRFQPLKMPNGSAVQVLDQQWGDSLIVYRDVPTLITAEPQSLDQYLINRDTLTLPPSPATFRFILTDPDGNNSVPEVVWYQEHSDDSILLLEDNEGTLLDRAPNTSCTPGEARLAGDTLTLSFDETIRVSAPARIAEQDLICSSCRWNDTVYTTENNPGEGYVRVSLGERAVWFRYYNGATVAVHRGPHPETIRISPKQNGLRFHLDRPAARHLRSIIVYDARGRTIARFSSIRPGILTTTDRLAPGMVHIRYLYADGGTRTENSLVLP